MVKSFSVLVSTILMIVGACAPKVDEVVPTLPGDEPKENNGIFSGQWLSSCDENSFQDYKSQRTEIFFDEEKISIETLYYYEDECFALGDSQLAKGTFSLDEEETAADNIVSYSENLKNGGSVRKYIRTMSVDDQFIITYPQFSQQNAKMAVAEVPLYRLKDWKKNQEIIASHLPPSSLISETGTYSLEESEHCEMDLMAGKPQEDFQNIYVQLSESCDGLFLKFVCQTGQKECLAKNDESQLWIVDQKKSKSLLLKNTASNEAFKFKKID